MTWHDEPIEELRELAIEPPPGFLQAVFRRLNRRLLVKQAADLSWGTWIEVLKHYLQVILAILPGDRETK